MKQGTEQSGISWNGIEIECYNGDGLYHVEPRDLAGLLEALPSEHWRGLSEIQYAPGLYNSYKKQNTRGALYTRNNSGASIHLGIIRDFMELRDVFYTMIGGHVYLRGACGLDTAAWKQAVRESGIRINSGTDSGLSGDFAESYSLYLCNRPALSALSMGRYGIICRLFGSPPESPPDGRREWLA